ncbi:MAG: aminotransferase class V-fold PLP-dependent enzyme [Phycisphaerae bacterium]|nr:aminotransferase class V-fold PLP-dependent enzyme [Phycisphaerae bacterium]
MKKFTRFGVRDAAPNDPWRPSSTPIYQTATFEQESPEHFGRYDYARSGNPTRAALEEHCARLEGACGACAFASGIAAVAVVTRLVRPGETIVAHEDLYGGSQRLLTRVCAERGIDVRYADLVNGDRARWSAALPATTALVLVESLSNPLWRAPDLRALADVTHERGAILCVDATAMSPWLQRPLALGADVVVHSATKLLSGHGDLTAGIVACAAPELQERIAFLQNAEGAVLGPFDSWLLLRGMKTLGVRIERQQESARRVAEWLAARDDVTRVHFASLAIGMRRERHARQADGPGVVLSFETGDDGRSADIVRRLDRFAIAVSFGSVDSSASLPCRMSHASVPADRQLLPPDLIRLSIGLEDPEDLIADLERALPVAQRLCPLQERVGVR